MTSVSLLLKGGKNGSLWKIGHPEQSNLYKRLLLPVEHKEHMPPKDKKQLEKDEILRIEMWIAEGANINQKIEDLKPSSFFYKIKKDLQKPTKTYDFSSANESDIEALNSPTLTLSPIATNSPALKASFFLKSNFKITDLKNLVKVSEQIVQLDLSKMPVNDEVFKILADFKNLETLNLSQTEINGKGIDVLQKLKYLKHISLANTAIKKEYLLPFLKNANPLKVFLWATETKASDFAGLKHSFDFGYVPLNSEIQKLNPPTLINEDIWFSESEKVAFKHSLKGTTIKYAIEDEEIDTLKSKEYSQPISLSKNTRIKVVATKEGWKASETKEFQFFKSIHLPQTIEAFSDHDRAYGTDPVAALCDRNLADLKNNRDPRWVAFKKNKMNRVFTFKPNTKIEGLTVSYASNSHEHIFPPQQIEIYTKQHGGQFKLSKTIKPKALSKAETVRGNLDIPINEQNIAAVKVIVIPLKQIPSFIKHQAKEIPWFFIDEVFFY